MLIAYSIYIVAILSVLILLPLRVKARGRTLKEIHRLTYQLEANYEQLSDKISQRNHEGSEVKPAILMVEEGFFEQVLKEFLKEFLILLAPTEQKARLVGELEKLEKQAHMSWEQILATNMGPADSASLADVFKALASQAVSLKDKLNREELTNKDEAYQTQMKGMVENFLAAQRGLFSRSQCKKPGASVQG